MDVLQLIKDVRGGVGALANAVAAGTNGSGSSSRSQGPAHSFPLLRRATVATLAELWLVHLQRAPPGSEWAAWARKEAAATLLQLFELHRTGMAARSVLEFLHISKAAGTSMCKLAEAARCRALDFGMGRTCLMRDFDDKPRWVNASHHLETIASTAKARGGHPVAFLLFGVPRSAASVRSCSARMRNLRRLDLDFFANEYTVYNEEVQFDAAALTPPQPPLPPRDSGLSPHERNLEGQRRFVQQAAATAAHYAAHVAGLTAEGGGDESSGNASSSSSPSALPQLLRGTHLCQRFANVVVLRDPVERLRSHLLYLAYTYDRLYERDSLGAAFRAGRGSAAWWRAFAPGLMDNYLLRSLAGEAAFALPPGALAARPALQLARALLAQYDVVLRLEAEPSSTARACSYGLGWSHSLTGLNVRNASAMLPGRHACRAQQRASGAPSPPLPPPAEGDCGEAWPGLAPQLRQLLPDPTVLAELEADAVQHDVQLYEFGALLSALDDVVWRLANVSLGEPLPGLWSGPPGAAPGCGYIHMHK